VKPQKKKYYTARWILPPTTGISVRD